MYRYSNGYPMQASFRKAVCAFIAKARAEGCTSTDEEIFAAWELLVMDALGVPIPAKTRRLAKNFEDEINGVRDRVARLN